MPRPLRVLAVAIPAALAAPAAPARAADPPLASPPRVARAARVSGPIAIDGVLDEAAWRRAPATGGFSQRGPDEIAPPTYPTEFRVLYGPHSLYVGVRASDPAPGLIRPLLGRRDDEVASDWILVGIDSYNDRRTAFMFALNPAGVQRDIIVYDDNVMDPSWDAVWEGAARVDGTGWSAEFRIPYNQLRFSGAAEQAWGFQVLRHIHRLGEEDTWTSSPRSVNRIVSRFGEVRGLVGIPPNRRLEITPYAVAGASLYRAERGDPLHDGRDGVVSGGLDFKLGLGPNTTVAGTVNPDFGQVEADPSQVNLGASELFFTEKRPFFLEGTEIFRFGITQGDGNVQEQLFYTRRIGAAPHGDGIDRDGYADEPDVTTIYGAAKLSGKTRSGWSFGLLEAVTGEETARYDLGDGSAGERVVIEPLTNYAIARLHKDFRQGRTSIGALATAVNRGLDGTGLTRLHDQAYTGGVQLAHRFADDGWQVDAKLMGSAVHGSPAAIAATQRSSVHWFQRPDADHVEVDETRTRLVGGGAQGSISKLTGGVRGAIGFDTRTPGFEANDLGFQQSSDYLSSWAWVQQRDTRPGRVLNERRINYNLWNNFDYGGEFLSIGGNVNGNATFTNLWSAYGGVGLVHIRRNPGGLRGGPTLRQDPFVDFWFGGSTDQRRRFSAALDGFGFVAPRSSSRGVQAQATFAWQIATRAQLAIGPLFGRDLDDNQYVAEVNDARGAPRYLMGRIDRTTTALTVRASYNVSPRLSLQLYAQPFVSTGSYRDYKEVVAPEAERYADRYHVITPAETRRMDNVLAIDRDGDGVADYSFERADFNFRQLRSNFVMRWEYRPGSTLFAIWSHGRTSEAVSGRYAFDREVAGLAGESGEHLVMAKLSYWLGL